MSPKKSLKADENLWTGLKVSIGLHIALVAFFTVRAVFFAPESINFESAVRVDMVALPDKLTPDQLTPPGPQAAPEKKPAEKPIEKPAPKPEPKPAVKTPKAPDPEAVNLAKKEKQKAALDKLKAMSAMDALKEEVEKENKKKAAEAAAAAAKAASATTKVKGNVLSAGTELTGLSKLQHDNYLASLDQQIKKNWILPQWLAKKQLRAQVRVKIDEKGHVISREIALSSGNSSYDDLALDTIDQSSPFPPPPEKFVSILEVNGLLIGFPE